MTPEATKRSTQSLNNKETYSSPSHLQSPKPKFRRRPDIAYNIFDRQCPKKTEQYTFKMVSGVMQVYDTESETSVGEGDNAGTVEAVVLPTSCFAVPPFSEYLADLWYIKKAAFTGAVASFSYTRLELLAAKFNMHILLNGESELIVQKSVPHR